jgi:autotransporter-associated beta strand protein
MIRRSAILCILTCTAHAQVPAFPGAEGFGAFANGGRGGDVYVVTNLNSSGAGSLYNGLTTIPANGRTIVFAVSGQIHLAGGIATRITGNKLTIAGQTAPGDGILLKDGTLRISGDDIVIRHLRFRHGKNGSGGDCIDLDSGCQNAILDHVSLSFSTDENISSYGSPPENLTMQWSLNAWGLEPHSCGGLWDQNHATCHHTLWAHNHTRNPKARPNALLEWTNNVTFDWDIGFIMGDSQTPAAWKANVIGNYFICPPGNIRNTPLEKASLDRNGKPNFSVWVANNLHDRDGDALLNGTDRGWAIVSGSAYDATTNPTGNYYKLAAPAAGSALLNIDPPLLGYKKLVSDAGPLRLDHAYPGTLRDEVDSRLMQNLTTRARNHITRESDLAGVSNGGFGTFAPATPPIDTDKDGMPDAYESSLGWNPAAQDHNTPVTGTTFFPAGYPAVYTRLEEYLHFKSVPHLMLAKGTVTSPDIDLARYTTGFSNNPVFTLANVTGGSATQSGAGGRLVRFTANASAGRGGFDFTVTDAEGSTWTRRFAVCITNSGMPADLNWRGTGSDWDATAVNWLKAGSPAAFSNGDRASFTDAGAAAPNVNIAQAVLATAVDVDSSANFTFTGAGSVSSTNALTKRGSGTLTLNNTGSSSFAAVSLDAGKLAVLNPAASGSAKIAFNGGELALTPASNSNIANSFEFNEPAVITVGSQHTVAGTWTGGQTVTVNATSSQLWTIAGPWTGFTGRLQAGSGTPRFRLNGTTNINFGSPAVAVDLGSGGAQFMNRNGATIEIGELASTSPSTTLSGSQTGTGASTYRIGGKNTDATFAGVIANGGGSTSIVKTGAGTWTLSGASTHTGTTNVSQGALLVDGSIGNTAVTVESAALLGGDGTIGGNVTANAGAILSPGTIPFTGAAMVVSGNLSLNGNTLYYDMSDSPAGANDRITAGGTLALAGTQHFQFLLLDGPLAAGTYDLVTASNSSASGVSLTHNLPNDSRQTFSLNRSAAGSNPSKIWLTVSGNPATLTWTGAANGKWDTVTPGNWTGASPSTFYQNDAVSFDDTAITRAVDLAAALAPRSITCTTALGYFLTGTGSLTGAATLVKAGAGTLTFANTTANSFTGGVNLNAGALALGNDTANQSGLGSGPVTLNSGTLSMFSDESTYNNFNAALVVPAGAAARINADARVDVRGTLAGAGTLDFHVPWVRTTLLSDWSAFSGRINVITDADGGDFRMGTNYGFPGFPLATIHLNDKVLAYYSGIQSAGAGTTIAIGALSGGPLAVLQGGPTSGRNLTYRIGGRNTDDTFAGTIREQNAGTMTSYVKIGTGIWTLAGTCNWNGGTSVEQGALRLTGSATCAGSTQVFPAALLELDGGSFGSDSINVAAGASIRGHGTLEADLVVAGAIETRGFVTGIPGQLVLDGGLFLQSSALTRMKVGAASDGIAVSGDVTLAGTIQVSLAAGTGFGRYRLITCTGQIEGTSSLAGIPSGTVAHLAIVNGAVDLVIDDSDEDGLPDSWELANFGNLAQGPSDDKDSDGTSNLAEYRLGLDPRSGASAFRGNGYRTEAGFQLSWPSYAGLWFQIRRSDSPSGSWTVIGTQPAGSGLITTFTDPAPPDGRAFYQILLQP